MKEYLKILCVTSFVQIVGFIAMRACDSLLYYINNSSVFPFFICVVSIVGSIIVSVMMAIKRGKTLKHKILMIILMPTNYTWIVYVVLFFSLVEAVVDVLIDLSCSFG